MIGFEMKGEKKRPGPVRFLSKYMWMGIETIHEKKGRRNWQGQPWSEGRTEKD